MPIEKVKELYNNLIKDDYDLPDIETFSKDMQDSAKVSELHSNLVKDNYDLPDINVFRSDMSISNQPTQQPKVQAELPSYLQQPTKKEVQTTMFGKQPAEGKTFIQPISKQEQPSLTKSDIALGEEMATKIPVIKPTFTDVIPKEKEIDIYKTEAGGASAVQAIKVQRQAQEYQTKVIEKASPIFESVSLLMKPDTDKIKDLEKQLDLLNEEKANLLKQDITQISVSSFGIPSTVKTDYSEIDKKIQAIESALGTEPDARKLVKYVLSDKKYDEYSARDKSIITDYASNLYLSNRIEDVTARTLPKYLKDKGLKTPEEIENDLNNGVSIDNLKDYVTPDGKYTESYKAELDDSYISAMNVAEKVVLPKTDIKNSTDYIMKSGINNSLIGLTYNVMKGEPAYDLYGYSPSKTEELIGNVVGLLLDTPIMAIGSGAGSYAGSAVAKRVATRRLLTEVAELSVENLVKSGAERSVAENIVKDQLIKQSTKLYTNLGASAGALGLYEGVGDAVRQGIEKTSFKDFSYSEMLKSTIKGSALGLTLGAYGYTSNVIKSNLLKSANNKLLDYTQKGIYGAGQFIGENAVFLGFNSIVDDKPITQEDIVNSFAILGGLKLAHAVPRLIQGKGFSVDNDVYKVEFTPEEIKLLGKGNTSNEIINNIKNSSVEELKKIAEDDNIPLSTKNKILWGAQGLRFEDGAIDYNVETVESIDDKKLVLKNSKGQVLDVSEYNDPEQLYSDANNIAKNVIDRKNIEKFKSLPIQDRAIIETKLEADDIKIEDVNNALTTRREERTKEQKDIVKKLFDETTKLEDQRAKEFEAKKVEIKEEKPKEVKPIEEKPIEEIKAEVVEEKPVETVTKETEQKPIEEVKASEYTPESKESARQFAIDMVETGQVRESIDKLAPRLDLKLKAEELERGIRHIKKGNYESASAKQLISKLEEIYKEGEIPIIYGTGGKTTRMNAPIESSLDAIREAKAEKLPKKELTESDINAEISAAKEEPIIEEEPTYMAKKEPEIIEEKGVGKKPPIPPKEEMEVVEPEEPKKPLSKEEVIGMLEDIDKNKKEIEKSFKDKLKSSKLFKIPESIVKTFHPFFSKEARTTASLLRPNLGEVERQNVVADKGSNERTLWWDKQDNPTKIWFITNLERGGKFSNEALNKASEMYRKRLDYVFDTIKGIKDLPYIEDYFPHFWKDPKKAEEFSKNYFAKNPLEGKKTFLKKRFYNDILEGMKNGLELKTDNPEELVRIAEINAFKFKMAHDFFNDLKDNGLVVFYRTPKDVPSGWEAVDDPLFKRMTVFETKEGESGVSFGAYYMPKEAADLIKRYTSRGIKGSAADVIRGFNNTLNQFQLGLSFFHGMTTMIDASVTGGSIGIDKLTRGRISGVKDILKSIPVINLITDYERSGKAFKDYKNGIISEDVKKLIVANARIGVDAIYKTEMLHNFKRNLVKGEYGKALLRFAPALLDIVAKPIFEYHVPRLKVSTFLKLSENELSKLKNPTQEQINITIQKAWDSVEDRLGQMTYDNIFWDKTVKDIGFLTARSLGWNLGTVRAFGKGIAGVPESVKSLAKGKGLNPNTAWVITLVGQVAMTGAIINYLTTGKSPEDWKDYFYPHDGSTLPDGSKGRIQLPTYMKEVFNVKRHGLPQTISSKFSPILNSTFEMMANKDFYGEQIYNEEDPMYVEGLDILKYFGKQTMPFTFRTRPEEKETLAEQFTTTRGLEKKFGLMPAPKDIERENWENAIVKESMKDINAKPKTHFQAERQIALRELKELIHNGKPYSEELKNAFNKGYVRKEDKSEFIRDSKKNPYFMMFKRLDAESQLNVWEKLDENEKKKIKPYLRDDDAFKYFIKQKPDKEDNVIKMLKEKKKILELKNI